MPEEVLELGKSFIEIALRILVLRMGFSWALHLAHVAHEELATRPLPGIPFVRHRQPLPDFTKATAILVYADNCDNMGHLSQCPRPTCFVWCVRCGRLCFPWFERAAGKETGQ